ncbi:MAG: hypothetical protein WC273_07025 [Dehalococcoidia bacterium]
MAVTVLFKGTHEVDATRVTQLRFESGVAFHKNGDVLEVRDSPNPDAGRTIAMFAMSEVMGARLDPPRESGIAAPGDGVPTASPELAPLVPETREADARDVDARDWDVRDRDAENRDAQNRNARMLSR